MDVPLYVFSGVKHYRMFKCSHGISYHGDLKKRQSMNYRNVSYSNDRRNNRSKGKSLPRRSQTCKPCKSSEICPFSLQISFDANGFYVVNGKGNSRHIGHPFIKDSSAIHSARHLSDEEKEVAATIINADAPHGVVKNVINTRTGLCLTSDNVAYLSNMLSDLKLSPECKDLSNADNLIEYLKHKNYDYLCLYSKDKEDQSGTILSTDNNVASRNIYTHSEYVLPSDEYADAIYFSKHHREKMKLSKTQNLLISVAWVIPSEREYFSRFPEVLFVDATAQTNNERRPLLLICGKDAKGKMFPVLRAFLPNERSWIFRWVFNVALPTLFSKSVLEKVNIIVSDGDSQEYSQIDICINNHLTKASRVRCGWHLVDRGWKHQGPSFQPGDGLSKDDFLKAKIHVKEWIYSWMRLSCESQQEYIISQHLLYRYLCSAHIVHSCGPDFKRRVTAFITQCITSHEEYYLFYKRKYVRHYDEYSNSCLEGVNSGIKRSATAVNPSMGLDKSMSILSKNGERKRKENDRLSTQDVLKQGTSSALKCAKFLLERGLSFLDQEWIKRDDYDNQRISFNEWKVIYRSYDKHEYKSIIPIFKRVRTVEYQNGYFTCDCGHFDRHGIPCRHMLNVLSSFPDYDEPSHKDVSVRYWRSFIFHANLNNNMSSEHKQVSKLMKHLQQHDVVGPSCELELLHSTEIDPVLKSQFDISQPCCVNYNLDTIPYSKTNTCGEGLSIDVFNDNNTVTEFHVTVTDVLNDQFEINAASFNNARALPRQREVWKQLSPVFKEMVSILEHESSFDRLSEIKQYMTNVIVETKQKIMDSNPKSQNGTYISSHVPSCLERKCRRLS